jgi:hypothetical protein
MSHAGRGSHYPTRYQIGATCNIEGIECALAPHCCVPGACLACPECIVTEQLVEVAEQVYHAGDVYCDLKEINAQTLMSDLVNHRVADPTSLSTGGLSSVLVRHAGAYLDTLECQASATDLKSFRDIAYGFAGLSDFPNAFAGIDIDSARIIPKRDSGVLNLPKDGYDAITLGSLIIVQDWIYDAVQSVIFQWPQTIVTWNGTNMAAVFTLTHELTHVRQYRELGRERFINEYLPDAVLNGYGGVQFENEAYSVSDAYSNPNSSWAHAAASRINNAGGVS